MIGVLEDVDDFLLMVGRRLELDGEDVEELVIQLKRAKTFVYMEGLRSVNHEAATLSNHRKIWFDQLEKLSVSRARQTRSCLRDDDASEPRGTAEMQNDQE